ncbi:MAG TPA: acyl-ACP thioesterase domain-containing protein [Candidatus Binatia bacterium]|nr:acyl-ACP thioesterase domain-containing protein [Candidatus Binatia bacterium]
MGIEARLERPYRVRFDEAGPDGVLRSSGYLRYAQDLAWVHSESAGFGREWYAERRLTWLVRAIELEIVDSAAFGTELNVSTEVTGFRRVWARRRSEFRPTGELRPLAVAVTDWVLLDGRGRLIRPPQQILDVFREQPGSHEPLRVDRALPADAAAASRAAFRVRISELDPMGHVNNGAYLDYLDEHYLDAAGEVASLPLPRRYRAEFIASAEAHATVASVGWADGQAWSYRLEDGHGRELFRARLEAHLERTSTKDRSPNSSPVRGRPA